LGREIKFRSGVRRESRQLLGRFSQEIGARGKRIRSYSLGNPQAKEPATPDITGRLSYGQTIFIGWRGKGFSRLGNQLGPASSDGLCRGYE